MPVRKHTQTSEPGMAESIGTWTALLNAQRIGTKPIRVKMEPTTVSAMVSMTLVKRATSS
jgi:hypothetical protein